MNYFVAVLLIDLTKSIALVIIMAVIILVAARTT